MAKPTAKMPTSKGNRQYHISCKKGDLSNYLLLPGDPERVEKFAKNWDKKKKIAHHREFYSVTGYFKNTNISCISTGIGAPSMAIVVEEAARVGVDTFIRTGSTGAIQKGINTGDLIINTAGVKLEGTSNDYVITEYPACANYEVVLALIEACERLKVKYHVGITASTDSFYIGEGRMGFKGYVQSYTQYVLSDLQKAGVINIEMETSALFTLASLYNLRAGSVCAVFDNLVTNEFKIKGEEKMGMVASEAVSILYQWDKLKKKNKKRYFSPSLLK